MPASADDDRPNAVIVAGAGVVHHGAAGVLRELVLRTDVGVLNTYAAKGLFPWDQPAHLGTIGLQARDVELAGLDRFDDVIVTGVDVAELPRHLLAGVRWREVPPCAVRSTPTTRRR